MVTYRVEFYEPETAIEKLNSIKANYKIFDDNVFYLDSDFWFVVKDLGTKTFQIVCYCDLKPANIQFQYIQEGQMFQMVGSHYGKTFFQRAKKINGELYTFHNKQNGYTPTNFQYSDLTQCQVYNPFDLLYSVFG